MYSRDFWYHWWAFSMLSPMSSELPVRVSGNLSANRKTHECSGVRLFECSGDLWACSTSYLQRVTNNANEMAGIKLTYRAGLLAPPEPLPINRMTIRIQLCVSTRTTTWQPLKTPRKLLNIDLMTCLSLFHCGRCRCNCRILPRRSSSRHCWTQNVCACWKEMDSEEERKTDREREREKKRERKREEKRKRREESNCPPYRYRSRTDMVFGQLPWHLSRCKRRINNRFKHEEMRERRGGSN